MVDGISIREAASELGVSVQTVHNLSLIHI